MFDVDDPGCGCLCSLAFIWQREYQGAVGGNGAVSMSGKGV